MMSQEDLNIRIADINDLKNIVSIYNQAVEMKFVTADTAKWIVEEKQQWFEEHNRHGYPIYIAELDNNTVGWISVSAYRPGRLALRFAKEISYYVALNYRHTGIGTLMLQYVIDRAAVLEIKHFIAILLDANEPSIRLLEKFKFQKWGHLPGIAEIDGKHLSHCYYGLCVET